MDQRFWIVRTRRAIITLGGNCGHRLPFTVKTPRWIRIFAPLACPGRTIEACVACVWVLAAHRALGLFVNLPDSAAPASCAYYAAKPPHPANRAAHAGDSRRQVRERRIRCPRLRP